MLLRSLNLPPLFFVFPSGYSNLCGQIYESNNTEALVSICLGPREAWG